MSAITTEIVMKKEDFNWGELNKLYQNIIIIIIINKNNKK